MSSKKINDLEEQYWSGQLSEDDEQLRVTTVQTLRAEREAREEKRILRRQKKLRQGIIRVLAVCAVIAVVVGGIYLYKILTRQWPRGTTLADSSTNFSGIKDESGQGYMVYGDGKVVPLERNMKSAWANKTNDITVFVKENGDAYFVRKDEEEEPIFIDSNAINGVALTEDVILSMSETPNVEGEIVMKLIAVSDQTVIDEWKMDGIGMYLISPNQRWLALYGYDPDEQPRECYVFDLEERKRYTKTFVNNEINGLWMVRDNGDIIWEMNDVESQKRTLVWESPRSSTPVATLDLGEVNTVQVLFSSDQQTMLVTNLYSENTDVWIVDKKWHSTHVTLPFEIYMYGSSTGMNVMTNAGWFTETDTKDIEELYILGEPGERELRVDMPELQREDGGFFGMAIVSMNGDIAPVSTEKNARFLGVLGKHILYRNSSDILCEGEIKDHTLQVIRPLDWFNSDNIYMVRDEFLLNDDDTEVYTELDPYEPYKRKTLFIDIDNGKEYELGPVYQILPTEKGSNLWYLTYTVDMTYNLMEFDLSTHNVILHDTNIHALTWWYGGNIEDLQSTSFNYYKEVMQDEYGKCKLELYHCDGKKSTKLLENIWEDGLYF